MSDSNASSDDSTRRAIDADDVERLLEQAVPRTAPPEDQMRRVRDALHREWRAGVDRRQRGRRLVFAGLAAAIAAIVAAAVLATRFAVPDPPAPDAIARVDKQLGSVYLVDGKLGLVPLAGLEHLVPGQVLQTAKSAGIGIALGNGVSVRLDEDSRMDLVAADVIYLQRGRVYVDSPEEKPSSGPAIRTDQGSITHLGTRYMVAIESDELTVSVRDGEVHIDGRFYDVDADVGDQVTLRGTDRPVVDRLSAHSEPWRWTEQLSPRLVVDGMDTDAFLQWVSYETGFDIEYHDQRAKHIAIDTILKGVVDKGPRTELRLRLLTTDLDYDIDEARGRILVRSTLP